MAHYFVLLFVVVVLCLCSTLCVMGYASGNDDEEVRGELFEPKEKINDVKGSNGVDSAPKNPITLCEISLPFFFAAKDGEMVVVAKAKYAEEGTTCSAGKEKVDILAKFIDTKNSGEWDKVKIQASIKSGKTQFVTEDNSGAKVISTIVVSAANANENKIYVFLLNDIKTNSGPKWEFKLVTGTISSSKAINWASGDVKDIENVGSFKTVFNDYKIKSLAADVPFFLNEKNFMFVVKGILEKRTGGEKKSVTALFQFKEAEKELTLLHVESTAGLHSSFFQWNEEIFKTPIDESKSGIDKIVVLNAVKERKFTQTNSPILRLKNFLKDKNNFAPAKIKSKNVLLLTQQKKSTNNSAHLWITDGTRVGYVGTIFSEPKKEFYGFVLHAHDKLFALHQTYGEETGTLAKNSKFYFTLLKKELKKITTILDAWDNSDNTIQKLYKITATEKTIRFANGIVGFLSGSTKPNEETQWTDQYLNVDATIHGRSATQDGNGFKFGGAGVGAQWPVKNKQDEKPYNFKDFGFTLLATVKIDKHDKQFGNSLLGVLLGNEAKRIGLWCSKDGKWGVTNGGDSEINVPPPGAICKDDEIYFVALILNSSGLLVYVDGQQLSKSDGGEIDIEPLQNIGYFYFGADKTLQTAKTDVTITDVLLYNRPFEKDEIEQLKPKKEKKLDLEQKRDGDTSDLPQPDESTIPTDNSSPNTSATPTTTENDRAEIKLCLFHMNSVTVLSSLLFVGFTLLGCYV